MSKLKAILFDYDGTLRDSRSLIYASLEHTFKAHDLPTPSKAELAPHIHHHSNVHRELANEIKLEDFEREYFAKVDELLPSVGLYEGAQQLLRQLKERGYKLAMVTAAKTASEDVKRLGIAEYFDEIVTATDITRHKPDPQGMNLALERLGVKPKAAIYVGDMMTDIYAAQAAKLLASVGVTIGMANRRELQTAGADYIIDDLAELPGIIEQIEER